MDWQEFWEDLNVNFKGLNDISSETENLLIKISTNEHRLTEAFFKIKKAHAKAIEDPIDDSFDEDLKSLGKDISDQILSIQSLKKSILKYELEQDWLELDGGRP